MVAAIMNGKRDAGTGSLGGFAPNALVVGMGATGAACARYFAAVGRNAWFVDSRSSPPELDAIHAALPDAQTFTGGADMTFPDSVTQVVVSPGVPLQQPLLEEARRRNLQIVSDIDLFVAERRAPMIAVTGSNGKSTVTSLTTAALGAAGWQARAGGNLGTPALDLLDPRAEVYVVELSSFQLERSAEINADVAVILNVSADHLDIHGSMSAYRRAKARVYAGCGHAVVNRDESIQEDLPGVATTGFTLGEPGPRDFGLRERDGHIYLACGSALLLRATELKLRGRHNLANALAAIALGTAVGGDLNELLKGLREFNGLPHRLELVVELEGVQWINDSKATNVGAAISSVQSVDGPLVLIAGGDAKGAGFSPLADALARRGDCSVVLIGRDREQIAVSLGDACAVYRANDLPEAVALSRELAVPGGTVLLAPACSSLDMFSDYRERGAAFAAAVMGRAHE